jgi:hypothetical protein
MRRGRIPSEMRLLKCGCWQRWIVGDIITSRVEGWVTVLRCERHR